MVSTASPRWEMVIHLEKIKLFLLVALAEGSEQHAARLVPHHETPLEVRDYNPRLSDQLFRLVVSVNAEENRAIRAHSVVQGELQELIRLRLFEKVAKST